MVDISDVDSCEYNSICLFSAMVGDCLICFEHVCICKNKKTRTRDIDERLSSHVKRKLQATKIGKTNKQFSVQDKGRGHAEPGSA
jgi:hypothetical protein